MKITINLVEKVSGTKKMRYMRLIIPSLGRIEYGEGNKLILAIRILNLCGTSLPEKGLFFPRSPAVLRDIDIPNDAWSAIKWLYHLPSLSGADLERLKTLPQIVNYLGRRALLGD